LPQALRQGLNDSKKLSAARRDALFDELHACGAALIGCASADVDEIDRLNILRATELAMARALAALTRPADHVLVDGNRAPPLPVPVSPIVRGDGLSLSIAAASIIAKVSRDRMMTALAAEFPGYGWHTNMGYGTAAHHAALRHIGLTPHHRRSFAPVRAIIAGA
jgi:ribonuclease HII